MPRLISAVPKYARHKRSGKAFVRIHGKQIQLGKYGTPESRQAYDRLIAEWMASNRSQLPSRGPDHNKLTVAELALAFLEFALGYYPKLQTRHRMACRVMADLYAELAAEDFGPLELKACRQRIVNANGSIRYCNDVTAQIVAIFKWGVAEAKLPVAVYQTLKTVPGLARGRNQARETLPVPPVSDDVVDPTLPFLQPIVADMVRLQRLTGVRPGELCVLRPIDIDRTGDVWFFTPASHKNQWRGKSRKIAIGPRAQAILTPYLSRDGCAYCFSPAEAVEQWKVSKRSRRKTRVQPSQEDRRTAKPQRLPGEKYTTESYRRALNRAARKAKVELWSPNRIRHTVGTMVRKEFGLEEAQVVLGHANARITEVYAERNSELAAKVARSIG